MALATPRFLFASDFPLGERVPLPGNGFLIGTNRSLVPREFVDRFRLTDPFAIPLPGGLPPITISLPGGCGPLETCSGPTVAGVCLGRCVIGPQFPLVPGGPGPVPGAPPPGRATPAPTGQRRLPAQGGSRGRGPVPERMPPEQGGLLPERRRIRA